MKNTTNPNTRPWRILFPLLMMAVFSTAKAQSVEFAPVGAEWYYTRYYRIGPDPSGITYDRFRSLRTIEINGWECKEIELYRNLDCYGDPRPYIENRFICQEGGKVYEVENGQRFLLYDFDKMPGESWYAPKYNDTITIVDISYMTLSDGIIRKILHTEQSQEEWYFFNIIEGIGMDNSLFPFDQSMVGTPCIHGPIRCYSENDISLIASETVCDYEVLDIFEHDNTSLVSMNTWVAEVLHINFSEALGGKKQISIIDISGRILYRETTHCAFFDILLSEMISGIYFTKIETDSITIINKFLKQ